MTTDQTAMLRSSRVRVPWTRGAIGGVALLILGAWAGIVAFIGPYLNFGFTPATGQTWYWTAARGYLEVVPGAAAFLAGLLLLFSTSRAVASSGGWLGMAAGAWLIIGPPLADVLNIAIGHPDPAASTGVQTLERLFYFFAIGAAILLVAAVAAGRLSVHAVRDLRAAERRVV